MASSNGSSNALLPPSTLFSCGTAKRPSAFTNGRLTPVQGDIEPAMTRQASRRSLKPSDFGASTGQGKILDEVTLNREQSSEINCQIQTVHQQVDTLKETLQELRVANCQSTTCVSADAAVQTQILREMRDVKNHVMALELTTKQHVTAQGKNATESGVAQAGVVQSAITNLESRLEARLAFMQHALDMRLDAITEKCATVEQHSGFNAKRSEIFSRMSSQSSRSPSTQRGSSPRVSPRPKEATQSPQCSHQLPESSLQLSHSLPQTIGSITKSDILQLLPSSTKKDLGCEDLVEGYQHVRGWNKSLEFVDGTLDTDGVWNQSLYRVQIASTILVLANIVFIDTGVRAGMSHIRRNEKIPNWIFHGDLCFTLAFILEMVARICAEGIGFVRGPRRFWNGVDIAIIILSVFEIIFSLVDAMFPVGNLSYLRVLRIIRVLRATQSFQVMAWSRGMRLILDTVSDSFITVFWVITVFLFFLYLAALGLTQLVEVHIESISFGTLDQEVLDLYGSVSDTMFTLLMAISGGAQWRDLLKPLESINLGYYRTIFSACVVALTFGVLNLLLAVIIGIANDLTARDRERILSSKAVTDQAVAEELRDILMDSQTKHDGKISGAGLSKVLQGAGAKCLASLGLEVSVVKGLFSMLEADGHGRVRIDELACSIMQLKADPAGLHVATVMYESKKILMSVKALSQLMQNKFAHLYSDMGVPIQ